MSDAGYLYLRDKLKPLARNAKTFGPTTSGSSNMQPQMLQTTADPRLATTKGVGIDRLSLVRNTMGNVTNIEPPPTKLQNEEMRPERKSARSAGNTEMAQTCK